ncbi:MAG: TonB-dependent receptor [Bacteroidota bacterium]
MIRRLTAALIAATSLNIAAAQSPDSVRLQEVSIKAYFNPRPAFTTPAAVAHIDTTALANQSGISLVPVLNTVPGVRMEERSPGSYRLSIRGSLLRSPFGVRNIKVYLDEIPFTDGGGNTYFNLIDPQSVYSMEILRGPDGSVFGANSGGVVRLDLEGEAKTGGIAGVQVGSYGLFNQQLGYKLAKGNNTLQVRQSWMKSDGYRDNSAVDRKYVQLNDRWAYSPNGELKAIFFYSDLFYETPGGLTKAQFDLDPKASRPATPTLSSASTQRAAISNKTFFGGLQHKVNLGDHFTHTIAVVTSGTRFENPFITNFEVRKESTDGVRSWLNYHTAFNRATLSVTGGLELMETRARITNYGNRAGTKDTVQAADDLLSQQQTYFLSATATLLERLILEASVSNNVNGYLVERRAPEALARQKRNFEPQTMPRVAASWLITNVFTLRASVSRGYSPPTLAEIRSSDNTINTALQPESGWNYETGFRVRNNKRTILWDVSVFRYRMDRAIVRQVNGAGQEFFVNSGGTDQPGLESQVDVQLLTPGKSRVFRGIRVTNSLTLYDFKFSNYRQSGQDYSGNRLTGVPKNVIITGLKTDLPAGFGLYVQHSYVSEIPLNDAGTAIAASYRLLQAKLGWEGTVSKGLSLRTSVGAENLLNEKYSLGNDLNAVGGRYYNAAPGRNYWLSLAVLF